MNIEFLIKNAIPNLNSINSIKIHTSNTLNKIIFKCYNTIIPFIKPIISKIVNHKNLSTSIINIKNQSADNRNIMESDTIKIENKKTNEVTNEIIIDKGKAYAIKRSINNEVKDYIIDDLNHNLKLFKDLEVNDIEKIKINIIENIKNINIISSLEEVCVLLNIDGIKSLDKTKPLDEITFIDKTNSIKEVLDSNIEKLYKAIVDPIFEVTKEKSKDFIAKNIKMDIENYLNIEISLMKGH